MLYKWQEIQLFGKDGFNILTKNINNIMERDSYLQENTPYHFYKCKYMKW
jgi:hypothetical protein